ncbi:unnamed protein product [Medioppia subpectinata]|uniref:Peroxin-7 n=1 Tax=Medioppia subpectinata TaxID=1979941 RepID=A0A7R9Q2C3_9ACAR|nr:unnamed protein product [Medioppia subpectinata]CAG2109270.1 unnamed protein product [Medioppia subpectinata]
MVLQFKTNGFNCYGVAFSPHHPRRLGCVSAQNYGIAAEYGSLPLGNILNTTSESQPNIVWTVSANGFIYVWELSSASTDRPICALRGHNQEIYSINWSPRVFDTQYVLTVSSDMSSKVWDASTAQPIHAFVGHESIVYCGQWSPFIANTFATASGDSTLKIWSLKQSQPMLNISQGQSEILSCDWNKFNQFLITTSDTNGLINVWDIRAPLHPMHTLSGHTKAVKCVKFSPHRDSVIGSTSYDMTTRLWDINTNNGLVFTSQAHTEFVFALDFNRHVIDQMADCSWDQFVNVFSYSSQYNTRNQL